MWRRHVTVYITTMSAFFAPAHAARVPIALLSTITSTISTNVAPRHVSCVAPEHVDTRVGAVDIRLPWPRNLLTTTVWAEAASPSNNHQKYFYHLLSWILVYSWPGWLDISYYCLMYTDGVSIQWESRYDLRVIFYWSFLGKMFRIFVTCQYEYIHDKYCCQRTKMIRDWQKLTNNENSRWFGLRNARMAH